jgi:hypothetical protein
MMVTLPGGSRHRRSASKTGAINTRFVTTMRATLSAWTLPTTGGNDPMPAGRSPNDSDGDQSTNAEATGT